MVELTEVPDEHFEGSQPGPVEDDADFTDTGKFRPLAPFSLCNRNTRRVENRRGKKKRNSR